MTPSLDDLTPAQQMRLIEYIRVAGPSWRTKLGLLWASGKDETLRDGALLRQIRNEKGPRWLAKLKLPGGRAFARTNHGPNLPQADPSNRGWSLL